MLTLTRRLRESIKIGDDITLIVLGIYGNNVRFGIYAPIATQIHREEMYKNICLSREKN